MLRFTFTLLIIAIFSGITCLIQISTNEGGDFIIDALAVREHMHKLNLAFTDPRKIKVSLMANDRTGHALYLNKLAYRSVPIHCR